MPLTNAEIQNAKATDKPIKLFDGRGLYLQVSPRGKRWWRLKYRFHGREQLLSLGVYPEVSLKTRALAAKRFASRFSSERILPSCGA